MHHVDETKLILISLLHSKPADQEQTVFKRGRRILKGYAQGQSTGHMLISQAKALVVRYKVCIMDAQAKNKLLPQLFQSLGT